MSVGTAEVLIANGDGDGYVERGMLQLADYLALSARAGRAAVIGYEPPTVAETRDFTVHDKLPWHVGKIALPQRVTETAKPPADYLG